MFEAHSREVDVFYCTNLINYTIAMEGLLRDWPRRAIVLYKGSRYRPRTKPGVWAWRMSYPSLIALRLLSLFWPMGTLYVPHHRIPSGLRALATRMRRQAYIDDGMDTLRKNPSNFDIGQLIDGDEYFTFTDYSSLPAWLSGFNIRRVAQLRQLLNQSGKPPFDLDGIDHVFIESPGLNIEEIIQVLALDVSRILIVRHPVEAKRRKIPNICRSELGINGNPEATLLSARDKHFYFGETMVGVFALYCGPAAHNTLWYQLEPAQWANLKGFELLTAVPELSMDSLIKVHRPGQT
jgi:hypothetical protein